MLLSTVTGVDESGEVRVGRTVRIGRLMGLVWCYQSLVLSKAGATMVRWSRLVVRWVSLVSLVDTVDVIDVFH